MHSSLPDAQMVLLDRFCEEARAEILGARTRDEAVQQRDALCKRFEQECASRLVINAAKNFVDNLLNTRWKQNTGNR